MKKALLVIDMQNVCVGEKHSSYFKYDNKGLIHEVNKAIDANENNLVVYIQNVMKKNLLNNFQFIGECEPKTHAPFLHYYNHYALEELSEYYDMSEYANIIKNYIIYFYSVNSNIISVISIKKSGCP